MTINVGINGMGRIGRMVIRAIIESQNKNIKIKGAVENWRAECRMGMPSQADQSIREDVNSRFRVQKEI